MILIAVRYKECEGDLVNFYISDPHFGHANIIKMCNRPFENIDVMNERLIEN